MCLAKALEWMWHRPTESNYMVRLPPEADSVAVAEPGYYQVRLSEMRLSDQRRWVKEIVPATFVLTEFDHGTERVRRPFFVSNGLLSYLPQGVDGSRLRVDFRNTLVLGPTPAVGGDVTLFVGLFQMAIGDRLKSAFAILEKLFQVIPGPVGGYLKLADQLTGEISACLGDSNLKCLLGDRAVIGSRLPVAGYVAYLKANGVPLDKNTLTVVDGQLMQRVGGALEPVADRDYCLVKIEHLAQREDYASLPFHAVFETARKSLVYGERDKARLQTLECIGMIYGSPDLSEDDKVRLITFYQAKLLAIQTVRGEPRGSTSPVLQMQARVLSAGGFEARQLSDSLSGLRDLHQQFENQDNSADVPVTNDDLNRFIQVQAEPQRPRPTADMLMRAVAVSNLIA
jgi:hypothetical protein